MIIVKLMGGLGNQLFQYAAGRSLSYKHAVPLKIDTDFLLDRSPRENFTYRNLELVNFHTIQEQATSDEIRLYAKKSRITQFFNKSLFKRVIIDYYVEKSFRFNPEFQHLSANTYLNGYWQTEKYFSDIRSLLLEEFTPVDSQVPQNILIMDQIKRQNAISVHIRRGDYLSNTAINAYHGVCDIYYYLDAIELIAAKVNDPILYFFSDDIEWARSEFGSLPYHCEFISHNIGAKSFEDLRLMSACKHNIIANSSFSWWGAWLNSNPQKIVIAPEKWFSNPAIDSSDLIPDTWLKLG